MYQTALQIAILKIPGITGYYWRKTFCQRGDPSVRIIILLGSGCKTAAATHAAIDVLYRELEDIMVNMFVVVTHSRRAFWSMREFD
jgi:hypothetical protein